MSQQRSQRSRIQLSEVGPRDGLQSIATIMPTQQKCRWIELLYLAGMREIEVGSFVSKRLLPQMADTAELVQFARTLPDLTIVVLAPNRKGAELAMEAGASIISIPVSVSHAHSLANVRKTPEQMVDEVRSIVAMRNERAPNIQIDAGISTAFGCTLQGQIPQDEVINLATRLVDAGADHVGLSDTSGMANPKQVASTFKQLFASIGEHVGAAHMHNTRGLGLANCMAALDAGVSTFDSSQAGIGGCPYAPGASGNVVTEDVVSMFESMGMATGIDYHALMRARMFLQQCLPTETLYGMTPLLYGQPSFNIATSPTNLTSSN